MQKPQTVLRLETVNVGTLIGRSAEAVETLGRRSVDICALQEVKYKKEGTKLVNGGEYNFKLYWMGEEVGQEGVGILIKSELTQKIVEVKKVNPRTITMGIVMDEEVLYLCTVLNVEKATRQRMHFTTSCVM